LVLLVLAMPPTTNNRPSDRSVTKWNLRLRIITWTDNRW